MSDDLTIDDLTVVGIDGIRRTFDEHYDTMMCVEQDPTGAHHAIHNQHARIEELEAANKLLNEQLDSIEEMGTESLNALPDCLMQLAPALVENDELKAKLKMAVETLGIAAEWLDDYSAFTGNTYETTKSKTVRVAIAKIKGEQL